MKIFFINRFFHPDLSATSQILSDLAFRLAQQGHNITILTSRQLYDAPGRSLPKAERLNGVNVIRLATPRFGRSNLVGRALDYLSFYLMLIGALTWHLRRGDVVVAKTDPPLVSVCAAPVVWLKRAKLINWLQDLFPEVAVNLGVSKGRLGRLAFRLMEGLRDRTLRFAATNVVLGERMAARLKSIGIPGDQVTIIPNWADGSALHPIASEANRLRTDWDLTGAFVVGYSGNLGRAHDIETIIAAAKLLEQDPEYAFAYSAAGQAQSSRSDCMGIHPERPIRWLFIGSGAQSKRLQSVVRDQDLTSFVFKPYQPRDMLSFSLSVPDVHLITLRPDLEGLIVPSKYYGIAAAGRPAIFIGDENGEIARILRDSETGLIVREGDAVGLARAISALANNSEWAREQGARARRLFEKRYDVQRAVQAWDCLLSDVASTPENETRRPPDATDQHAR